MWSSSVSVNGNAVKEDNNGLLSNGFEKSFNSTESSSSSETAFPGTKNQTNFNDSDKDSDELLSLLGLDLRELSPRSEELLTQMAVYKTVTDLRTMDPMNVHCWYTDIQLEKMELEPYILQLEQKIATAEREIEIEKRNLDDFKADLTAVKNNLAKEMSLEEFQKKKRSNDCMISTLQQNLVKLEIQLQNRHIPTDVLPESMRSLKDELELALKERDKLKSTAYNITLVRSAKKDLLSLKNKEKSEY